MKRRIHTLVLMKEGKSGIRKAVVEYFLAYLYHPELDGSGITEVGEKTVDRGNVCHSERSEESLKKTAYSRRFFASLRMTWVTVIPAYLLPVNL